MENTARVAPKARINARLIEQIPIAALQAYSGNARTHSQKQIAKLSRSIARFGVVAPILVDEANVIIAGHAVVDAVKLLGMDEVPALRVEHLSEAEKRALRLALNRLAEDAEWNPERLAAELRFLVDAEFEIDLTGFEIGEIDFRLEEDGGPAPDDEEIPQLAADAPAITRPGDIWLLGNHRLLCGDPREQASYEALLVGERAAMAFADPPHNFREPEGADQSLVKRAEFVLTSDEVRQPEYVAFLSRCFALMAAHSADGAMHFIGTDDQHLFAMKAAAEAAYGEHLTVVVWDKMVAGMGEPYRNQHELILVEKVGTAPITNTVGRKGRSNRTTVWAYREPASLGGNRQAEPALRPTTKPVALVADAIVDVSRRHDIVLDPFAGLGTTVLAADKTGRRARVMEIDRHHCDVIVRRWQAHAGGSARHAKTGLSFEAVAAKRHCQAEASGTRAGDAGLVSGGG